MSEARQSEIAAVARLWGETAKARAQDHLRGWLDHPVVLREYVQPKQSGHRDGNWLPSLVERCQIGRGGRWLSIGCGQGATEIAFANAGLWSEMQAYDVAPAAIEQARSAAADAGVTNVRFEIADLAHLSVPAGAFDVVLMIMSLHHALDLKATLRLVRRSLRPGGFFLVNEYVGPARLQYTDLQLLIVQRLLSALPERLRIDCITGGVKSSHQRLPTEHWLRVDPSEAVHSSEILSQVDEYFDVVERIDYGGTVLSPLLEHIVHNFDSADVNDVGFLKLLATAEDLLVCHGVLPSDFTVLGLRKPERRVANWIERLSSACRARWREASAQR